MHRGEAPTDFDSQTTSDDSYSFLLLTKTLQDIWIFIVKAKWTRKNVDTLLTGVLRSKVKTQPSSFDPSPNPRTPTSRPRHRKAPPFGDYYIGFGGCNLWSSRFFLRFFVYKFIVIRLVSIRDVCAVYRYTVSPVPLKNRRYLTTVSSSPT
jgi:hypothetical protein